MGIIRKLPDTVANKIAAGEVIERPASVVKELLENSIDAESSRIEIELEEGGLRLIRISDDGTGISSDDLALAVQSHATSKLVDSDDLFFITTLGFRGEAVPSIGAVSDMRIASRVKNSDAGAEIEMRGGAISHVKAAGVPEGTLVEVRNLFFNIPARRKFLKTTSTEMSHIVDTVTKIALAYPSVGFKLTHNGREVFHCLPGEERLRRIASFFGKELQDELLSVDAGEGPLTITGYAAPPSFSRANSKLQYVFLNGRFIRDKAIASAIRDAYQGKIPLGRQPIVVLFMQIDPREVDVNVHPTKHEVRFRDSHLIYTSVRRMIEARLASADAPSIELDREKLRSQMAGAFGDADADTENTPRGTPAPAGQLNRQWNQKIQPRERPLFNEPAIQQRPQISRSRNWGRQSMPSEQKPAVQAEAAGKDADCTPAFVQVHNTYIIEETAAGIRVIDQHAIHERILYNRIRERLEKTPLECQRLLIPVTMELTRSEVILATGAADELRALGFEVEEFGTNTLALRSVPVLLAGKDAEEILHSLIAQLQEGREGEKAERLREGLVCMIACRAAVKANQPLTDQEILSLLEKSREMGQAITCPHGRPASLAISLAELEKHFLRK